MVYSTQGSIEIAGIKDGIVINKDGSYRLILLVAATNFALKSENEQNALIFQYQSFLNSLHFPIEIVIRSKRLDLTPYLAKIKAIAEKQPNELIQIQSMDYVDFVGKLITIANIMKKTFYVSISFTTISAPKQVNVFDKLFGTKSQVFDHIKISDQEFKNSTEKLFERANIVASGLGALGLHCSQLSTEEIIELFYEIYNPGESAKERIDDAAKLAAPIIGSENEEISSEIDEELEERGMIDNTQQILDKQHAEAEFRRQSTADGAQTMPLADVAATAPTPQTPPEKKVDDSLGGLAATPVTDDTQIAATAPGTPAQPAAPATPATSTDATTNNTPGGL
jgi:hypothetical protein